MSGNYKANKPLALVACALYFIPSIAHTILIFTRKSRYMIPFTIGCYLEAVGYLTRYLDAAHPSSDPNSSTTSGIISLVFIILAPAFMAATHYMIFKRIARQTEVDKLSFFPIKFITAFFVTLDVASILIQATGGAMSDSTDPNTIKIALDILKCGYILQVFGVAFFYVIAIITNYRVKRAGIQVDTVWTHCLRLLFLGSFIILFRAVYRFIEICVSRPIKTGALAGQTDFPLMDHEYLFYIFDTCFILPLTYLFLYLHPSRWVKSPAVLAREMEEKEHKVELTGVATPQSV